jgi:putative addiction module CopG family antidote
MTTRHTPISIRLSRDEREWIDSEIAHGRFETRSEAVHAALARVRRESRELEIRLAYQRGYTQHPFPANAAEEAWQDAAEESAAALVEE